MGLYFLTEFLIEKPIESYSKKLSLDMSHNLIGIWIRISIGNSNAIESGPTEATVRLKPDSAMGAHVTGTPGTWSWSLDSPLSH